MEGNVEKWVNHQFPKIMYKINDLFKEERQRNIKYRVCPLL